MIRIYPLVYFVLAALLMAGLHWLAPAPRILSGPYRYVGGVPIAIGVGLVLWVALLFRRSRTTIMPFEESTALVVSGPFRISRNPIYLGMVLALVGVALVVGSITPFLVLPAFAYVIDRRFIRREEAALEQTFGAEYRRYRDRVRRWL